MGKYAFSLIFAGAILSAGSITTYTDATAFGTAVGAVSVEDFTSTSHFPILGLTLNSMTDLPAIGITPGTILPGVTYSTTVGATQNEDDPFNIDTASGYVGGVLDARTRDGINRPLIVTFTGPVTAFGFDTDGFYVPDYSITINFVTGPSDTITFSPANDSQLHFYGFASSAQDIVSATLTGSNSTTSNGFVIDNFTYTAPATTATPEPSTWMLGASGLLGLASLRLRSRK
jgi:MYXO-CTERM domain-containing protein